MSHLDQSYLDRLEHIAFEPIFIMGEHRSGTTLLYQTLAKTECFNVIKAYHVICYSEILNNFIQGIEAQKIQSLQEEFVRLGIRDREFDRVAVTPDLPEEYGFILRNEGYDRHLTEESFPLFRQICRKIHFTGQTEKPILLKNPWCFPHFMEIKQAIPNARFIFIHRNPIPVINSKLKAVKTILAGWNDYTGLISSRYRQVFKNPFFRTFYRVKYLDFWGLGVKTVVEELQASSTYFLENIKQLPASSFISVRYEDLCEKPEQILEQIFDAIGLVPEKTLNYETLIQRRSVSLLPDVEKRQAQIYEGLKPYFVYHGYRV